MERREGEEGRGKRRGEGRGGGGRGGSIVEEGREYTQMCMCVYACVCVCVCVCGAWMGACNSTQSTTD